MTKSKNLELALVPVPVRVEGADYTLVQGKDGQPLMRDRDVASVLGYADPRDIRELIARHRQALGEVQSYRAEKPGVGSKGGRPQEGYLVSHEQALYLAAKAETPNAVAILQTMIKVFLAAQRGLLAQPQPLALPAGRGRHLSVRGQAVLVNQRDGTFLVSGEDAEGKTQTVTLPLRVLPHVHEDNEVEIGLTVTSARVRRTPANQVRALYGTTAHA